MNESGTLLNFMIDVMKSNTRQCYMHGRGDVGGISVEIRPSKLFRFIVYTDLCH